MKVKKEIESSKVILKLRRELDTMTYTNILLTIQLEEALEENAKLKEEKKEGTL